jgi:beta-1,2-mannobiose phosphorylase / 1,2-beta-oligomannan phosphorylase
MVKVKRFLGNPVLNPNPKSLWEAEAAFNGCIAQDEDTFHMVYRAVSTGKKVKGHQMEQSTVGHALSFDRIQFLNRHQLIYPEFEWEQFGCEDPRVTKLNNTFYITYTALSDYPHTAAGIHCAIAKTTDFRIVTDKHLVTPFNAKAMALFPETINGKIAVIFAAHTDEPPAKICIAQLDHEEDLWNPDWWNNWHKDIDTHALSLLRSKQDHVEVGAPPIKTKAGWLLLYCYISNYFQSSKVFGIEAIMLDIKDPTKVIGRTTSPLLTPERDYEIYGKVPNVIFPTGAVLFHNDVGLYYGGADTNVCLATFSLDELLKEMLPAETFQSLQPKKAEVVRYSGNPIISPIPDHVWENKFTLNPGAILLGGKVHLYYRAQGTDETSVFGYATTRDGFHIDERLDQPVYVPRESFEMKTHPGFSGVEDARLIQIGNRVFTTYTAYDGSNPPRIAMSTISVEEFLAREWKKWTKPILISPPGQDDKDCVIFPEKVRGKYVIIHRFSPNIWIDFMDDLESFGEENDLWLGGKILMKPRRGKWDNEKVGISPPVIKTKDGWLMIYHAISKQDLKYRHGVVLLDLEYPDKIIARLDRPILEPETPYENNGLRPGTTFANGAVVMGEELFLYYGGADTFTAVATINLPALLAELRENRIKAK